MMGVTPTAPPKSLGELAKALSEIAEAIDAVTSDTEALPLSQQVTEVVDRIEQFNEIDGPAAAFHGVTYAWLMAKFPHLDDVLSIEGVQYRQYVVLRTMPYKVSLLLPRVFSYTNDEWADRAPEVEA
jgi:hypothetical protein